jgi:hypothetical protein
MALTQIDKPFNYTRKGQRLFIVYSSDNSANTGFKFGFELTEVASGKTYTVYISPDLSGRGVFDMSPLVNLRHQEEPTTSFQVHADTCYETDGNGFKTYDIEITEWWLVNGVFTQNTDGEGVIDNIDGLVVTNSYFQPYNGYKPDTISVPSSCNYGWEVPMNFTYLGVNDTPWYAYSDRTIDTSAWYLRSSQPYINLTVEPYVVTIFCRWNDLGTLTFSTSQALTGNALDYIEFTWVESDGTTFTNTQIPVTANEPLAHIKAYPGSVASIMPANTAYYYLIGRDSLDNRVSAIYLFVNEETQGNWNQNCNYTPVRLCWVNSRGGWDYWNFQLRSERTTSIERKQYNSVLKTDFNYGFVGAQQPFYPSTRMLTDRSNLNTTSLLVTSDWLSDNEFTFLRSLLTSNQVQIIENQDYENTGCYKLTPVSIEQSSFVEQKNKDGKLHNMTLNLKFSQPYWGL